MVPVDNSRHFAAAMEQHHVEVALHLYYQHPGDRKTHGTGLGEGVYDAQNRTLDWTKMHPWTQACFQWLKTQKFLAENQIWPGESHQ